MEIDINSDEYKISNNKLRYYFDDITKFENNKVILAECMLTTYFENIRSYYSMRVKYDGGFYNINSHSYFKISKTLRLNIHYLILFKIPINQLSQIYIDKAINIEKEKFYEIISNLNRYEKCFIRFK